MNFRKTKQQNSKIVKNGIFISKSFTQSLRQMFFLGST